MILNLWDSHTIELDKRYIAIAQLTHHDEYISGKPQIKSQKILRPRNFLKSRFQAFFYTNNSFFGMALMEFFGPYKPIDTLEALLGDFGPETEFLTLTERNNFQVF